MPIRYDGGRLAQTRFPFRWPKLDWWLSMKTTCSVTRQNNRMKQLEIRETYDAAAGHQRDVWCRSCLDAAASTKRDLQSPRVSFAVMIPRFISLATSAGRSWGTALPDFHSVHSLLSLFSGCHCHCPFLFLWLFSGKVLLQKLSKPSEFLPPLSF